MDNCLASNSETGGVGCDNMTVAIVGILNGQTQEEWYNKIAERVANGDGPCAPVEYGEDPPHFYYHFSMANWSFAAAEFRGPGVHHNFEDSDSNGDMDMQQGGARNGFRGGKSRIIYLGDGSQILTGSEDTNMIDNEDEDADLANQANKAKQEAAKGGSVPEKLNEQMMHAKEAIDKQVNHGNKQT